MKVPQRKNNRYMSGEELIKKAYGLKKQTTIEEFGQRITKKI